MQPYIQQLLDDISAAHRPEEPEQEDGSPVPSETEEERAIRQMEEHFAEVERFINEDPPHNLSYYCGLSPEQFPSEEQLTGEQVSAIVDEYLKMLGSWNIDTDIPLELSDRKAYTLLISLLHEHFHIDRWGISTWSFCECNPPACAYGEHCFCRGLEWLDDLPEGDEDDVMREFRERDLLRKRLDDDFRLMAGDKDLPY